MVLLTKKLFKSQEEIETEIKDKEWSKAVRSRDNWQCVFCGKATTTNAHHLVVREFLPLKYDLDNGLTLCIKHHKYCRVFSGHNNAFPLFLWLETYRPEQYSRLRAKVKILYAQQEGLLL